MKVSAAVQSGSMAVAASRRVGRKSVLFTGRPSILSTFTVAGPMEGEGPLGPWFDTVIPDTFYGERCWEQTESKMLKEAILHALQAAGAQESDVDLLLTGDLLSQCVSGSYAARDLSIPHLGLYSACASFAGGLITGAMCLEGGFGSHVVVAVSSHHDAAERQFRFPTELGVQRPPTAQWTATLAAAVMLGYPSSPFARSGPRVRLVGATLGEVIDIGIKDPYDMGTAMAPAAADTLATHFKEFRIPPSHYDLIVTGDLGAVGKSIATDLLESKGLAVTGRFDDCGLLLYDRRRQDVHAGGSGAACSAGVFSAYLYRGMIEGRWRRILFAPTGALHSPTVNKQGEAIPAVCHAVAFEVEHEP